ncbi:MAG TPA: IPT/TIG domain-containing protein [Bryobacteraceae bacterium]|jgi:uncharacterized protein (TIGR03437 family)
MQKRVIALFFAGCLSALAQSVTLQNSSFESATLPLNEGTGPFSNLIVSSGLAVTNGTLTGWTASSTTDNAAAGAIAPYSGGENWSRKWFDGNNVAYLQIASTGMVSLIQTPANTNLQNNTMYTLTASVGRRLFTPRFNYSIQLWAGPVMLASAANLALGNNASGLDTLSYSSGSSNSQAGQPLKIVLSSSGAVGTVTEAFFDDINLTAKTLFSISGVVSATAFGGYAAAAPGDFIEIYGTNLATGTRDWNGSDFDNGNAPTSLDGTSVTVAGQKAFVSYISPAQVNVLIPSNVPTGQQPVTVTNALGTTSNFTLTINAVEPGLLAPSVFHVNDTQYAVAFNPDGTYALPAGSISGVSSHPAAPGDTLVFYGLGFGPVNPSIPAGQLVAGQSNALATTFQMFIGGIPATSVYAGLAPNYTGLYQFNVVVPNVPTGNAVPVTFALGGTNSSQTLNIAIQ